MGRIIAKLAKASLEERELIPFRPVEIAGWAVANAIVAAGVFAMLH